MNLKIARGFSLIEVLFTVIIISVSLFSLLEGISQGLRALASAEKMSIAATLARQKMNELEAKQFQVGGQNSGDFANHKDYHWKMEIKDPDLAEAKDFAISQVNLTISWNEDGIEKNIQVSTYTARIEKLQE